MRHGTGRKTLSAPVTVCMYELQRSHKSVAPIFCHVYVPGIVADS